MHVARKVLTIVPTNHPIFLQRSSGNQNQIHTPAEGEANITPTNGLCDCERCVCGLEGFDHFDYAVDARKVRGQEHERSHHTEAAAAAQDAADYPRAAQLGDQRHGVNIADEAKKEKDVKKNK